MRKLMSVALGGAMAMSVVAFSATGASADGRHFHRQGPGWQWHYQKPPRPHNPGYNLGAAIVTGTVLGLAIGSLVQPSPYPYVYSYQPYPPPPPPPLLYPRYVAGNPHFQWCAATYPNYNSLTNMWTDIYGYQHPCVRPY